MYLPLLIQAYLKEGFAHTHGQNACTHFGSHRQAGEISTAKRVAGKPFIGNGYYAFIAINILYPYTTEKCAGQIFKKKNEEFKRMYGKA